MRIAYICMDPGIPVFGTKGASVHIQEVIREMRALATRWSSMRPAWATTGPMTWPIWPWSTSRCAPRTLPSASRSRSRRRSAPRGW